MKLAVGQRDVHGPYGVVGVVRVGWELEVERVIGVTSSSLRSGPRRAAGAAGTHGGQPVEVARLEVRPSVRVVGPAGPRAG